MGSSIENISGHNSWPYIRTSCKGSLRGPHNGEGIVGAVSWDHADSCSLVAIKKGNAMKYPSSSREHTQSTLKMEKSASHCKIGNTRCDLNDIDVKETQSLPCDLHLKPRPKGQSSLLDALQKLDLIYNPITKQLQRRPDGDGCECRASVPLDMRPSFHWSDEDSLSKMTPQEGLNIDGKFLLGSTLSSGNDKLERDSGFSGSRHSTLERTETSLSLSHTNDSSFSSISSLSASTDISVLNSANLSEDGSHVIAYSVVSNPDPGEKRKRKGLSTLLPKSLLSWRHSPTTQTCDTQAKVSGKGSWPFFHRVSQREIESGSRSSSSPSPCGDQSGAGQLIFESRPSHLPTKAEHEEARHAHLYKQMLAAARRKEFSEAKVKEKEKQKQLQAEQEVSRVAKIWTSQILPHWATMKDTKKTRDLWFKGLPSSVRGTVWKKAIGNNLNITHEMYDVSLKRARERLNESFETEVMDHTCKEGTLKSIGLDISRTFPMLGIFQKGGPYHDSLHDLLCAYVCLRPDMGYVQGMSFLGAILLLQMEQEDAFVALANLLSRPLLRAMFSLDEAIMEAYFEAYEECLKSCLPVVAQHLSNINLGPNLYLLEWLFSIYSKPFPLDISCRIWDIYLRDEDEFLFQVAIGILRYHEPSILQMDFITCARFLTKLPTDAMDIDKFFSILESPTNSMGGSRKSFSHCFNTKLHDVMAHRALQGAH